MVFGRSGHKEDQDDFENQESRTSKVSKGTSRVMNEMSWCCNVGPSSHGRANREFVHKGKKEKSDYKVDPKYMVAQYDIAVVLKEEEADDLRLKVGEVSLFKAALSPKTFKHAILGITFPVLIFFLLAYYAIQIPYLLNQMSTCDDDTDHSETICHEWYEEFILDWRDKEATMTRYLTFVLGFYVSQMIKRWWDQVKILPEIEPVTNALAAFVQRDFNPDGSEMEGEAEALNLKKKLARYCLLSWTLCMASISKPLNDKFNTAQKFLDKKLLTQSELKALKVESGSEDGWKDQWWIPITWAICLVNPLRKHKGFQIKENKDFISTLSKFQQKLEDVTLYQNNPLPLIYGQALNITVYSWLILGILGSQELGDKDHWAKIVFLHFPYFQFVKVILIYGWMQVANIVRNPFGTDKHYDLDLVEMLDHNIWKASIAIKNIENILPED